MYEEVLRPGRIVAGRYEIVRAIGRGGMSVVFAAADLKLGRKLRALKAMRPDAPGSRDVSLDELRVLQRISHPRLPQVVDVVPPEDGLPLLLVTDFVEGEPLAAAARRLGRGMPPAQAAAVGLQLCDALAYLHGLEPPVIHLDIKPSNILIDASGGIRLIDFGIARQAGEGGVRPAPNLGTPGYAAPEQQRGGPCGPASDMYAVGALLHGLLAEGRLPSPDEQRFDRLPAGVPAPLKATLAQLLRREPAERPSARQAAKLLAAAAGAHVSAGAAYEARPSGPLTVGVASFSRGAGATFVALALAALMARIRPAALIEHPANEPEVLALLAGGSARPHPADHAHVRPVSRRHIAWEAGPALQVHALLDGPEPARDEHSASLPSRIAHIRFPDRSAVGRPIAVLDLSSYWQADPASREAAAACGVLLMIADPQAQRWTQARREACGAVKERRTAAGLPPAVWLANRDAAGFGARRDWLALLPERPSAVVPQLPPGELADWLWKGKLPDEHPIWRKTLENALRPVTESLLRA